MAVKSFRSAMFALALSLILTSLGPLYSTARAGPEDITAEFYIDPYPTPYFGEWETRTDITSLTISNMGSEAAHLKVFMRVTSSTLGEVASGWSLPFDVEGMETRVLQSDEFIDYSTVSYNASVEDQVRATNRLPEGVYTAHVEIWEVDGGKIWENEADFNILSFRQPSLITPLDGEVVLIHEQPFEWESVTEYPDFEAHYRLRIYEVNPGQSPSDAVSANSIFYEDELVNATSLVYPFDAPPFESGRQYAWYVQALDRDGRPIGENDGRSEIWTFYYGSRGSEISEVLEGMTRWIIAEGFAYLEDLSGLSVSETEWSYVFNGTATLVLEGLPTSPSISVSLEDFAVDKATLEPPTVTGGRIYASVTASDLGLDFGGLPIEISDLQFDPGGEFTLGARISFHEGALAGEGFSLEGRLTLSASGVSGDLSAEAPSGGSLVSIGGEGARLNITRVEVHFSDPTVTLDGKLLILGSEIPLSGLDLLPDGTLSGTLDYDVDTSIRLVPDSDLITVHLAHVAGTFSANLSDGTIDYNIALSGDLAISVSGGSYGGQSSFRSCRRL